MIVLTVGAALAVGAPAWPSSSSGWDGWLLIALILAVVLIPRLLHRRRSPFVLGICLAAALLLAATVEAWGVPAATAIAMVAGGCVAGFVAIPRHRPPPV